VVHHCDEPLSQHRGYGSAAKKKKKKKVEVLTMAAIRKFRTRLGRVRVSIAHPNQSEP